MDANFGVRDADLAASTVPSVEYSDWRRHSGNNAGSYRRGPDKIQGIGRAYRPKVDAPKNYCTG